MIISEKFPLLDHISSGILAVDRQGRIVLWNRIMEQWRKLSREDVIGCNLFELFPETDTDPIRLRIEQVLQGGAPVIFSSQLHHHLIECPLPDGSKRRHKVTITWLDEFEIALFNIQDQTEEQKLITQYRCSAKALEEQLQQRQQLEKENLQLSAAIDQAIEAIVIFNSKNEIVYANRAFSEQIGWNKEEIATLNLADTIYSQADDRFLRYFSGDAEDEQGWQGRQKVVCKDGSSFTASISISPILDDAERFSHLIMIQEDISEQMSLEENFRNTQKQEALITLVGGIAHDFNNLLAALVGQLYLASREVKSLPKTAERLNKINGIAHEASEIVRQLLTFARQGEHESKEFPLNSFIKEFIKLAGHSIPDNIQLIPDFASGHYAFRGDANQLQQALLNIVQNAVDAIADIPDGRIEISLFPFDPETSAHLLKKFPVLRHGNFAHISIRDNGKGMSSELLEKIFDPFFSTKQLGDGLGLAMTLGCIRNHHGIIDVESRPDVGSVFHIFLPTIQPREAAAPVTEQTKQHSAEILLVDDDERVLEPTKELLESMGHHVTLARDGLSACECFKAHPETWDIVITDMVMPKMGGLEAAQAMRKIRPDIPVIFATGYDPSLVSDDARKMPTSKLISKPFNPDNLDRMISEMIQPGA